MFKHHWSRNFVLFGMLLKIQVIYWFTNYINLIVGLGVALYTMVCWLAFKSGDPFLLASGISVGILRNGMIIYTTNLIDWKSANTNQRLYLTPISPVLLGSSIVFFNFLTTVGVGLIMFIVAIAFFPIQRELVGQADWLIVLSSFVLVWLTSMALGLVCYKFIPNLVYARMVMLLMYTLALYLLGLGFPIQTILSPNNAWLGYVIYAFPHRFSINLAQAGFANWHGVDGTESILKINEMPIFNNQHEQIGSITVDFGYQGHLWLAYLLAVVAAVFYFSLPMMRILYQASFYRRDVHGELVVNQKSSRYIHNLRHARDFQQVQLLYKARLQELTNRSPELQQAIGQIQHEVKLSEKIKSKKVSD